MANEVVVAKATGDFSALITDTVNARDAAQAAENGAVSARETAEGYRDDAESARSDAQSFRTQAVNAKTDAEKAEVNATLAKEEAQRSAQFINSGPPSRTVYVDANFTANEAPAFSTVEDGLAQARAIASDGNPVSLLLYFGADGTPLSADLTSYPFYSAQPEDDLIEVSSAVFGGGSSFITDLIAGKGIDLNQVAADYDLNAFTVDFDLATT